MSKTEEAMVTSEEKGVQAEALAKAGHGQRLESWGNSQETRASGTEEA